MSCRVNIVKKIRFVLAVVPVLGQGQDISPLHTHNHAPFALQLSTCFKQTTTEERSVLVTSMPVIVRLLSAPCD